MTKIIGASDKTHTIEAQRLARYFRLLAIREKPEPKEDAAFIIKTAQSWIKDYPGYLKTPEGYGLRYLLAKVEFQETQENPKLAPADKDAYLQRRPHADCGPSSNRRTTSPTAPASSRST